MDLLLVNIDVMNALVPVGLLVLSAAGALLWWILRRQQSAIDDAWRAIRDLQRWRVAEEARAEEREARHSQALNEINGQLVRRVQELIDRLDG